MFLILCPLALEWQGAKKASRFLELISSFR